MDSPAPTTPPTTERIARRMLPMAAVFAEDVRQILRHWAFLCWAGVGVLLTLLWFVALPTPATPAAIASSPLPATAAPPIDLFADSRESNPNAVNTTSAKPMLAMTAVGPSASAGDAALQSALAGQGMTVARFAAKLARCHLLLWITFAIALGASAIASELDGLGDAVLCRGVSRTQYFLAKVTARTLATTLLFLFLVAPALAISRVRLANDATIEGLLWAAGETTLIIGAVTVMAVAGGAWFRSPLAAAATLWMAVYGVGIAAAALDLTALSPLIYVDRLPMVLQGQESTSSLPKAAALSAAAFGLVTLLSFQSKDL